MGPFKEGQQVEVLTGQYTGKTGRIVNTARDAKTGAQKSLGVHLHGMNEVIWFHVDEVKERWG